MKDHEKEILKNEIRKNGIKVSLSMSRKGQKKELTKADVVKMVEDNFDKILSDENDPELDISEIFKR